ncbi:serine hydrolase [Actinokineospora sp. HUAS TT18]|uniref:serine hydrolase n=1 Tax=Actinokineospora sp. HUAS TT18 TaxID=3447451 RepID=UPI003F52020F
MNVNRRSALGLGAAAVGTVLGVGTTTASAEEATAESTTAAQACGRVSRVYQRETEKSLGTWASYISVSDVDGTVVPAVDVRADVVVEAYSVNKIAVAVAVLDKVDRGLLRLDQQVEVSSAIVIRDTDGIFGLDGAYPSNVTIGHALATLLTVSDNTCVRLCGLVCPAAELNEILRGKGFVHTQVKPVANPNRFFLGTTTARETHTLLQGLVNGTLLSPASTAYLLSILRSLTAFTDGIRLNLSSAERLKVATKAGWFADGRNEAGIVFNAADKPTAFYSLFASGSFAGDQAANADNYSANHPALKARQVIGRTLVDAVARLDTANAKHPAPAYRAANGD